MISEVDTKGWEVVGATTNARFFRVERGVLAALALSGTTDDGATAKENRAFQEDYFRKLGHAGVVIVFLDGFVSQDKDARRVYQEMDGTHVVATAMIAESLLGRAIASFSVGIRRPKVRVKMFATIDDARVWARVQLAAKAAPTTTSKDSETAS